MAGLIDYNSTASSNTTIAGVSLQEGQTRARDLNDQIRQLMADLKSGTAQRAASASVVQAWNLASAGLIPATIIVDQIGLFYYDSGDTSSADDGATVLVTASGQRYKIFGSISTKAPNVSAATKLTIASGAVIPSRFAHTIETESLTSSDDLDTLTATNFVAGNLIMISAFNTARTVVVKHGTGNILLPDDTDISLDDDEKTLLLRYNGTNWVYIAGAGAAGGGSVSDTILNAASATELTISSGAITPTRGTHTVDTESDAASDDLATITATNFSAGNILALSAANGGRTVVLKHGTGNIVLPNDLDLSLDDAEKTVFLRYDGTNWNYVAGGGISASPIIPNTATGSELTIASGAIVPTQFSHTVDSEGDASTDDLDTITATNFKVGDIIAISAESASHVITVKHGTGNILLPSDADIELDDTEKTLLLRYDGTNWNFIAGASVATGTVSVKIPNSTTATELTISSGAIVPVRATHTIDTESDASTDDLATITATNFSAGQLLWISAESATRTIVVKHGAGNILLPDDTDISLDDNEKTLCLRYDGTNWNYVSGVNTGAGAVSAKIPNSTTDSELTISGGAIVPTRAVHTVDTESDAASDDLVTITATNYSTGQIVVLSAESASRAVVLKHGTGNIVLPNDRDITLNDTEKTIVLRYDGAYWNYVTGAGVAATPITPNIALSTELTIASGAIVPVSFSHTVDTESDAASDDLATITATHFKAGDLIAISAANASRVVTVKHGSGNILLPNDRDVLLNDIEKTLVLRYNGTNWCYVAGGGIDVEPIVGNTTAATELTISSGAITPTQAAHTVDTQSDAATDDLDTITATYFKAGYTLTLAAANAARTVVVKNGTGNIVLPGDYDIALDDAEKTITLRYDGANWQLVAQPSIWVMDSSRGADEERIGIVGDPALDSAFGSELRVNRRYSRHKVDIISIVCSDPGDTPEIAFIIADGEPGAATKRDGPYPGAYIYGIPYDGANTFLSYPHSGRNAQFSLFVTETTVSKYARGGGIALASTRNGTITPIDRFWIAPDGGTWIGFRGTCEDNAAYDNALTLTDGAISSGNTTLTSATGGFSAADATAGRAVRVKRAVASTTLTDGAMTAGSATLTSATGGFVQADADNERAVRVLGAGAAGAELYTSIVQYIDTNTVVLDDAAATTVSGATVYVNVSDLVTTISGYTDTNTVSLANSASATVSAAEVYVGVDAYNYSSTAESSAPSGYHNYEADQESYGALNIIASDDAYGAAIAIIKSGETGGNRGDTRFEFRLDHATDELKIYRVASGSGTQIMALRNSSNRVDFSGTVLVEGTDSDIPYVVLRNQSEAGEKQYYSIGNNSSGEFQIGSGSSIGSYEKRFSVDETGLATVRSTASGSTGAQLNLYHDTASPAVSDFPGIINFQGEDSAGNKVTYGSIASVTTNVTDGGTEAAELRFYNRVADDNTKVAFFNDNGGFVIGSPATQTRATGTMTAVEVWDDNTQLTDLVIDMAVDGSFDAEKYANHPIKESLNQAWFNPDWYAEYWQNERCLPGMVTWSTPDEMPSLGELVTRLTAVVETQAVLIENLNQRIKDLEAAE